MRRFQALSLLASLVIGTLVLTGCTETEIAPVREQYSGDFAEYYNQQVEFAPCEENLRCASIEVPMDWSNPDSEAITLALIYRISGKGESAPFILFNPGGPGASGYDWVAQSSEYLGTEKLRSNFNLLGFDPRGVGRSSPVECLKDSEYDDFLYAASDSELGSEQDIEETKAVIAGFSDACKKNTGDLLGFVDTVSAAKDMDVIRAVIGAEKLNYLGYSYGTLLGTTYATLFPERVGRFVLDGAIDPTISEGEQDLAQVRAFEKALTAFLKGCDQFADCPFTGDLNQNLNRVKSFLYSLEKNPLPTKSQRELTIWAAVTGLIMPLYSKDYWPMLSSAFAEAFRGKGNKFLAMADYYNDRAEDGSYTTNLIAANFAISCLDSQPDASEKAMQKENEAIVKAAPVLGRYWQFGPLRCADWPYPEATKPTDYSANGSQPIVVIGTTGDPATPFEQAVSLAHKVLANGYLISYQGEGHTIYGQGNVCVNDAVDEYFLTGKLAEQEPSC